MNYNQNIHHRRSIRLKGYDYSQAGAYFITICCQDKEVSTFGEIIDGKMILNDYGTIAYNEWGNTPNVRNNVELDVFVIMPNHIHGIIILNDNIRRGELNSPIKLGDFESPRQGFKSPKGTVGAIVRGFKSSVTKQINIHRGELHSPNISSNTQNYGRGESNSPYISPNNGTHESHSPIISPNSQNEMGEMISPNLKGECNSPLHVWQRDYYEHIIRNDKSYQRISDYIINNPANWTDDKFCNFAI